VDPDLAALADAHGVGTRYVNWQSVEIEVDPEVVISVLRLLDVDPSDPAALANTAHAPVAPPATHTGPVTSLPTSPSTWGWMLQLYALRSAGSWGVGDFADLATFTAWAASTGAGAILLNPLHAVAFDDAAGDSVPASPYSPSSRRFINPLYLRIEHTDAYRDAGAGLRGQVDALRPAVDPGETIDYDTAWRAKRKALELLWAAQPEHAAVSGEGGIDQPALRHFATFNALVEQHGADWRRWPEELRHPGAPGVAASAACRIDAIAFHAWLQRLCAEQLRVANAAAAGMPVGIVHDLAVGIDPGGADAWMLQDVIAAGAKIGAPPDAFNQQGQDWGLATWRPDRLAATGYAAYRDMLRGIFGHAGGLRVDHVAGLWRLWWVPPGKSADQGTYVHCDPDAMLGILVDEARAAGSSVIGEDLGTVLPIVTEGLQERNLLGSAVLWFTRDADGGFVPPAEWPERVLATVSTHDLPTAAGYLTGEHVLARAEAGVLGRDVKEEWAAAAQDRARLLALLDAEGLIEADSTDEEIIIALHELLARTPCRLVLASPYDVLGEVRQPNLPGTLEQYPNWRIPLPLLLEEVLEDPRMRHVAEILNARSRPSPVAERARPG
jgi:4-alpha-glucanotransferase